MKCTKVETATIINSYRGFMIIVLLLVATLFRVWGKVEISAIQREIIQAEVQIEKLSEERRKLLVEIVLEKTPNRIHDIAHAHIGLVPAHTRYVVASTWPIQKNLQ